MHGIGALVVPGVVTVHGGFGVSINDVVYYLDVGVVGLVRLGLSIGFLFWVGYVVTSLSCFSHFCKVFPLFSSFLDNKEEKMAFSQTMGGSLPLV